MLMCSWVWKPLSSSKPPEVDRKPRLPNFPGKDPHSESLHSNTFVVHECIAAIWNIHLKLCCVSNMLPLHPNAPGFVSVPFPHIFHIPHQFPEGRPGRHWPFCKTGLLEDGSWLGHRTSPTGVVLETPLQTEAMISGFNPTVLAGKWSLGTSGSRQGMASLKINQLEREGSVESPGANSMCIPCHHLIMPTFLNFYYRCSLGLIHSASAPRPPDSGTRSLLLQGFWSGIHNNGDSKFTSLIGNALWETQQMGSNCRPVVGTLLTNTQVAVYRAFWNRMWLGSWGRQSNYQHLSFLFNEGECGKRPCLRQPGWRKMPALWRHRAYMLFGGHVPPRHPGASLSSPWNPDITLGREDGIPGIL